VDSSDDDLGHVVEVGKLRETEEFSLLKEMNANLIAIPTPLSKTKAPALSYIRVHLDSWYPLPPMIRRGTAMGH
jgi:UDP-N-acetyl-D-mannosaminuronate dehydrogenase